MDVHQCPRCELRFATRVELVAHLTDDHTPPDDPVQPPTDSA